MHPRDTFEISATIHLVPSTRGGGGKGAYKGQNPSQDEDRTSDALRPEESDSLFDPIEVIAPGEPDWHGPVADAITFMLDGFAAQDTRGERLTHQSCGHMFTDQRSLCKCCQFWSRSRGRPSRFRPDAPANSHL